MTRFVRTLCTVALLLAGTATSFLVASPAHAAGVDALCATGSDNVTFSPGIVLVTQRQTTITSHIDTGTCVTSASGVTSATVDENYSVLRSCNDLLAGQPGSDVFTWNTSQTSTFTYTQTVTRGLAATVITYTGTITAGLFNGDTAVLVETIPNLQFLDCLTSTGMTATSGIVTFTVTDV